MPTLTHTWEINMLAVKFTANEFRKQFVLEKAATNGRTAQLQCVVCVRLCGKAIAFLWETFLQTNEIEPNRPGEFCSAVQGSIFFRVKSKNLSARMVYTSIITLNLCFVRLVRGKESVR